MAFDMNRIDIDTEPGIEWVNIQYTWTPLGAQPDWGAHRETRMMPRGGTLIRGLGGTTRDDTGQGVQTQSYTVDSPDDDVRRKVSRLPKAVCNPATGEMTETYMFHHDFEILKKSQREQSLLYSEQMVSQP